MTTSPTATGSIDVIDLRDDAPPIDEPMMAAPAGEPAVVEPPSMTVSIVRGGLLMLAAFVAMFAVYAYLLTPLHAHESQDRLRTRYQLLVQVPDLAIPAAPATLQKGEPVGLITIPKIGLERMIVEGSDADTLRQGPGHLRNTPLPGQPGNAVIAAKRRTFDGPFGRIGSLVAGDKITVNTVQGTFTYVVRDVITVQPGEPDVIGRSAPDRRLTLVTGEPALPSLGAGKGRLAVIAQLEGAGVNRIQAYPSDVTKEESSLNGNRDALLPLVLGVEGLLVALLLTVYARQRWLRWPTWLLATPVICALALVVFDSLARLLPSTV